MKKKVLDITGFDCPMTFIKAKEFIKSNLPVFGICLGHQILSLTLGAKTKKMFQGHRGANHPVKNLQNSQVEITSQNHGFEVDRNSFPSNVLPSVNTTFLPCWSSE